MARSPWSLMRPEIFLGPRLLFSFDFPRLSEAHFVFCTRAQRTSDHGVSCHGFSFFSVSSRLRGMSSRSTPATVSLASFEAASLAVINQLPTTTRYPRMHSRPHEPAEDGELRSQFNTKDQASSRLATSVATLRVRRFMAHHHHVLPLTAPSNHVPGPPDSAQ